MMVIACQTSFLPNRHSRRLIQYAYQSSLAWWPLACVCALVLTGLSAYVAWRLATFDADSVRICVSRVSEAEWRASMHWSGPFCNRAISTNDLWYGRVTLAHPLDGSINHLDGLYIGGVAVGGAAIHMQEDIEELLSSIKGAEGIADPEELDNVFFEPVNSPDVLQMKLIGTDMYGIPFRMLASQYEIDSNTRIWRTCPSLHRQPIVIGPLSWEEGPPGPQPTSLLVGQTLANALVYFLLVHMIIIAWRSTLGMTRMAQGRCISCGYLLIHSMADRCSECGIERA